MEFFFLKHLSLIEEFQMVYQKCETVEQLLLSWDIFHRPCPAAGCPMVVAIVLGLVGY